MTVNGYMKILVIHQENRKTSADRESQSSRTDVPKKIKLTKNGIRGDLSKRWKV